MPTGRTALVTLVAGLVTFTCVAAAGAGRVPERIVFPVVGKVSYTNDYGDPRGSRSHEGNDLMGARWQYAVAVERGRVEKRKSVYGGYSSCYLVLRGKSGTHYWYIHLNNDKPGGAANDNRGGCKNGISWPRGLRQNQRVRAGQIVGFVGDSGDADGIQPHLHFEVRPNGGGSTNPYPHLRDARRLVYAAPAGTTSVRLQMWARVGATSPRLTLRSRLFRTPAGRFFQVRKWIGLDVPTDVVVERKNGRGQFQAVSLTQVESGDRVVVWTNEAAPSLANQRPLPGAWEAKRVRLVD